MQGQANAAEEKAQEAQQSADAAQQTADDAIVGNPPPPPAPPASTEANQMYTLTLTANQGATVERTTPEPVPDGSVLQITDLVFNNPQGDVATLTIGYGTTTLLTLSTENYRDLDLHFVSPIEIPAGSTLRASLACITPGQPPGRTPTRCFSGVLATGALVTPPAG